MRPSARAADKTNAIGRSRHSAKSGDQGRHDSWRKGGKMLARLEGSCPSEIEKRN